MPRARLTPENSVSRTIHFWRIYTEINDRGLMRPFDGAQACADILAISGTNERYLTDRNGVDSTCWLEDPNDRDCFVMATIKRRDFPLRERRNGERELLQLRADEGLAEIAHFRFLPGNVLGVEYNHYGPRASRLKQFLQDKRPEQYRDLQVKALIDRDTLDLLANLASFKRLDLKLTDAATLRLIHDGANYMESLHNVNALLGGDVLEVSIGTEARNSRLNTDQARNLAQYLYERRAELGENSKVMLHGYTANGGKVELDLLSDKVIATQRVLRMDGRSRTVNSRDAFRAIGSAYNRVRDRFPAQQFMP